MNPISSRQNALIKRIRRAIEEHGDEIVIEGPKHVIDATSAGWKAIAVLERNRDVTSEVFDSIAETRSPQGMIGLFERPRTDWESIIARRDRVAVALDTVQDPGNVGTIVRLAAAFDAAGVLLLPGSADPFAPKAIRASAGAILGVSVASITHDELITAGVPLIAAVAGGVEHDPPGRDAVLVFGSEGMGVSEEILRSARKVSVPMSSRVESLNVAAAAAILLSRSYAARSR